MCTGQATPVVGDHSAVVAVLEFSTVVALKDGWPPKLFDVGTYSLAACQPIAASGNYGIIQYV